MHDSHKLCCTHPQVIQVLIALVSEDDKVLTWETQVGTASL